MNTSRLFLSLLIHILVGLARCIGGIGAINFYFYELLNWNFKLHVLDDFVLFGSGFGFDSLPW